MKRGARAGWVGARTSLTAITILLATPAMAQELRDRAIPPPADAAGLPVLESDDQVAFAADALDYDDNANIVTASGDVRMSRAGNRLRADKVVWNRATGEVRATGNVAVVNPGGDTAYGDDVKLADDLHDGVIENFLLVLADGGRLAAREGSRKGDITTLADAAYTPCPVDGRSGCAREPSWKITALRITHDQQRHRIYYRDARFHVFGIPILWLPSFSHPDGSNVEGGGSGFLLPDVQYNKSTGLEFALPYYVQLAPNRDLTLTPHLYTSILPALEGTYRHLDGSGAFQVRAMGTYAGRQPATLSKPVTPNDRGFRGFVDANGTYQFGPYWTVRAQARLETDRTFMRRYDISNDDRLRSAISAERLDANSYLTIGGWYVQTLRPGDRQGQQAIALPAIDYRRRFADPLLGGVIQAQANSLALTRPEGQDTQRVFGGLRWDLRKLTGMGQEVTFTAYSRADLYHTDETGKTATIVYRGAEGWHARGVAALAVDARWPFIGNFFGGSTQITPRVQFVASPRTRNLVIPDEDSRSVDLEDSNLFALNRFSGYDRWEDGNRVTYGAEWSYQRPWLDLRAVIGQSYRLTSEPTILPQGTGLSDRFSDIVGRVTARYGRWLEITERFRVDKDSLTIRRNEVDATIGGRQTYLVVGYLKLNRNIDTSIEDLRDREELRLGGRLRFARYWSIFGSTVIDLTGKAEDPTSLGDGFEPVRDRLGIAYEDECIAIGVSYRRNHDAIGGAVRGSTFALRLALKNIGR